MDVCNNYVYIRGIKELIMKENTPTDEQTIKEISFNFGLLLYLKEELSMLKNKSYDYFVRFLFN